MKNINMSLSHEYAGMFACAIELVDTVVSQVNSIWTGEHIRKKEILDLIWKATLHSGATFHDILDEIRGLNAVKNTNMHLDPLDRILQEWIPPLDVYLKGLQAKYNKGVRP